MEPCRTLLQKHILGLLQENLELLSDSGRDRMFNGVSGIFCKIYVVLASEPEQALAADHVVRFFRQSTMKMEAGRHCMCHSLVPMLIAFNSDCNALASAGGGSAA